MPRDYGKLSISIWRSRKFKSLRDADRARLLYFYLHTCPQTNSCGCFNLPVGYAVTDLGWSQAEVLKAIDSLSKASLIGWDSDEEVVRIVGFLDHDPPTNPKHAAAVVRIAIEVPDCAQKLTTLNELLRNKHCENIEALASEHGRLSIAYREAIETPLPLSPIPNPLPEPVSSLRSESAASPPSVEGKAAVGFQIPDWVPAKPWNEFIAMRKKQRKAPTDEAMRLVVVELTKLRAAGQDPAEVLNQSIRKGWLDVYAVKSDRGTTNGNHQAPPSNSHGAGINRAVRRRNPFGLNGSGGEIIDGDARLAGEGGHDGQNLLLGPDRNAA